MKVSRLIIMVFMLLGAQSFVGQVQSTKATQIILIVNKNSSKVEHIELLASFKAMKKIERVTKYKQHKFFLGVLKGTYTLDKTGIVPGANSTIIMYTKKQYDPPAQFFQENKLTPGDTFPLGTSKAKVVSNHKGELTLKTQ